MTTRRTRSSSSSQSNSSKTRRSSGKRPSAHVRIARKTGSRTTAHKRTATVRRKSSRTLASRSRSTGEITYVFECTRQDCGYRIVRDEKAEPGQLRFDIKCPKCHNEEFRCLGKGDLPDNFPSSTLEAPASPVDYTTVDNRIGIGSS